MSPRSPLDERGHYPHEEEPAPAKPKRKAPPNPEAPSPDKVDPAAQQAEPEVEPSDVEGQEGVGPGPRDLPRMEEGPASAP